MVYPFQGLQRFISVEREIVRENQHTRHFLIIGFSSLNASARRFSHGIAGHRGGNRKSSTLA